MLGRAEILPQAAVGQLRAALIQQTHRTFHAEDAGHRVVDPRHRDFSLLHEFLELGDVLDEPIRNHRHVHAGVDRRRDRTLVVLGVNLVDGAIVRDEEALEADLLLQDLREQPPAGRALDAVPTAVGRHDRGSPAFTAAMYGGR